MWTWKVEVVHTVKLVGGNASTRKYSFYRWWTLIKGVLTIEGKQRMQVQYVHMNNPHFRYPMIERVRRYCVDGLDPLMFRLHRSD